MNKTFIEEQQKQVQSDPWLIPLFDPSIPEQEKRIAVNTLIFQTILGTEKEIRKKIEKQIAIHKQLSKEWTGIVIGGGDILKSRINPHTERAEELSYLLSTLNHD